MLLCLVLVVSCAVLTAAAPVASDEAVLDDSLKLKKAMANYLRLAELPFPIEATGEQDTLQLIDFYDIGTNR